MEQIGKKKKPENEIQLDLPFGGVLKEEKVTIPGEGEFHEDYIEDFENENDNEDIPVTHLNEEELKKMAEDPEQAPEYHALMIKIAEAGEKEQNKKNNEMAKDLEAEEIANKKKKEEEEEQLLMKNDDPGDYRHFTEIVRKQKEEEIKKQEQKKQDEQNIEEIKKDLERFAR